ncbi:hypothetical protein K7X08_009728 [Anisodus acutangulus]|uniref:Uncharacterized protein n=1 Tax=Anisodus acutangulus TaxID=402998 RepID=A0A9Q1RTV9_9SOLA|nr:hypothetical protein K7X08_009728 [Anisodus acutangulus]
MNNLERSAELRRLSDEQSELSDIREIDGRGGLHDRHGNGDSGGFNANDDHGSDGPDHGKDSLRHKENSEKVNIGAQGGFTNA